MTPKQPVPDATRSTQSCDTEPERRPAPEPASMSKLSDAVKALINAGHARPGYTRASAQVQPALARFASDAAERNVGLPAWVTVSVCAPATTAIPR